MLAGLGKGKSDLLPSSDDEAEVMYGVDDLTSEGKCLGRLGRLDGVKVGVGMDKCSAGSMDSSIGSLN